MSAKEDGLKQIENAIVNFPGYISDDVDLTEFMDEQQIHKIKRAKDYQSKLIELITNGGEKGLPTPWETTRGKFEFRPSELTIWSERKAMVKVW